MNINPSSFNLNSITSQLSNIGNTVSGASKLLSLASSINGGGNAASNAIPANINGLANGTSLTGLAGTNFNSLISGNVPNIQSVSSIINDAVSSATVSLAKPSFAAGAKDTLAAADVYRVNNNSVINSIQSLPDINTLMSAVGLKGDKGNLSSLSSIIALATNAASSLLSGNPLDRLGNISRDLSGAMRGLPPGISSTILGSVSSVSAQGRPRVNIGGGAYGTIPGGQIGSVNAVGGLINRFGCNPNAFNMNDPYAWIGALLGLILAALGLGMPNAFGSVMCGQTNRGIINQVSNRALPQVIRSSDIGSLYSMTQMTSPGSIMMGNPNVIGDFNRGYGYQPGYNTNNNVSSYSKIIDTFSGINSIWNSVSRAGSSIFDLSSFTGTTPEFGQCMRDGVIGTNDTNNQNLLLGQVFKQTDVFSELGTHFSGLSLDINNPIKNMFATDPITLASLPPIEDVPVDQPTTETISSKTVTADGTITNVITNTDLETGISYSYDESDGTPVV